MQLLDCTLEDLVSSYKNNHAGHSVGCNEKCRSMHVGFFTLMREKLADAGDSRITVLEEFEMLNLQRGKTGVPLGVWLDIDGRTDNTPASELLHHHSHQCQKRQHYEPRELGEEKTQHLETLEVIHPNSDKFMEGLRLSEIEDWELLESRGPPKWTEKIKRSAPGPAKRLYR
jgi:hypothetical protein